MKGIIAPSDVSIKSPTVSIFATYGVEEEHVNEVNKKKLQFYVEKLREFLSNYNSPEKIYPESYVNNISISDAEVELYEVELDRQWILSDLSFEFNRNFINMKIKYIKFKLILIISTIRLHLPVLKANIMPMRIGWILSSIFRI